MTGPSLQEGSTQLLMRLINNLLILIRYLYLTMQVQSTKSNPQKKLALKIKNLTTKLRPDNM